jgi:hypothetical protein
MLAQLYRRIPTTPGWQISKIFALNSKVTIEQAIQLFQANEAIEPVEQANVAQETNNRSRGGRSRGYRNSRYRGRSRNARNYDRNGRNGYDRNDRNDRGNDRNGNRSNRPGREVGADECRWCRKEGHYQYECDDYLKAQRKYIAKKRESTEEARVAVVKDEYHSSGYSYEHANTVMTTPEWILDSGASKHFSGMLNDFQRLKRWNDSHRVRLADGSYSQAEGIGQVKLNHIILNDVWYVPDFGTTRLLSSIS